MQVVRKVRAARGVDRSGFEANESDARSIS